MGHKSLLAAKTLAEEGIEAEVIDVITLVPFDWETVSESVSRTGRLIIVHEDTLTGGWGAEVGRAWPDSCIGYLQGPIRRVTAPDTPVPFAPVMENSFVALGREDRQRRERNLSVSSWMSVTYMDVICLGVLVADIFASPMPALLSAFATAYGRPSLLDWILFEKPKSVFHLHMTIASPTSLR